MRLNRPNIQPEAMLSFDTLLAFANETLTEGEYTEVAAHLAQSPSDEVVVSGIQLFIEQEDEGTDSLELFLDDIEKDYEAILSTFEAERAIASIKNEQISTADDYVYDQAVDAQDHLNDTDRRNPTGYTAIGFVYPLGIEAGNMEAVVLSKDTAAFIHTEEQESVSLIRHLFPFYGAQLSREADYLLTQTHDYTLRMWNREGEQLAGFIHEGSITDKHFSYNGKHLLTASRDGKARLWDMEGEEIQVYRHEAPLRFAKFVSDGSRILTGDEKGNLKLWDLPGIVYKHFQYKSGLVSAALSPSGRQILGITDRHTASLRDLDGNELWRLAHIKHGNFLRTDPKLLCAMTDNTAKLWDLYGDEICTYPHEGDVHNAHASPTANAILTASADSTARIWALDGQQLLRLDHPDAVQWAIWGGDGTSVITLCKDQSLRLWRKDGKLLQLYERSDWPRELT